MTASLLISRLQSYRRQNALTRALQEYGRLVKTIFIHAFMDVHTFEVERIRKCCTHYALPDGRLMPGCAYNLFFRDKDPRYAGEMGKARIWTEGTAHAGPEGGRTLPVTK